VLLAIVVLLLVALASSYVLGESGREVDREPGHSVNPVRTRIDAGTGPPIPPPALFGGRGGGDPPQLAVGDLSKGSEGA
jgi:hypothetical protein